MSSDVPVPLVKFGGIVAPPKGWCPYCGSVIELEREEHRRGDPGERIYSCRDCGAEARFYSAAWLR